MKRRLLVARLSAGAVVPLSPEAAAHARVLRLSVGDAVTVFDGDGHESDAVMRTVGTDFTVQVGEVRSVEAPPARYLVLGVVKKPAMDLAIRMATECGATHVLPVQAARSVPSGSRPDRWLRIAEEAARQSGRADVPDVAAVVSVTDALSSLPAVATRRIALPGAPPGTSASGAAVVMVGPEGGWTVSEIDLAIQAGFAPMGLGRFVLRTPTAVVAALTRVAS